MKMLTITGKLVAGNNVANTMELVDEDSLAGNLEKALASGPVMFVFRKADGTERTAIGTTSPNYFPQKTHKGFDDFMGAVENLLTVGDRTPENERTADWNDAWGKMEKARSEFMGNAIADKVKTTKPQPHLITYFDLTKMMWRSCKKENLVCMFNVDAGVEK